MILSSEQIDERIQSPLNLLNRLRNCAPVARRAQNVYEITARDIIPNLDEKLNDISTRSVTKDKVGDKALAVIDQALDELKLRLPEVRKPEKIASVIRDMSQVVRNTDNETRESSNVQFIFHVPQNKKEADYEVIDIR